MTFRATGQLVEVSDSVGAVPGVGAGTPYAAEYTFDSAAADQDADPSVGAYPQPLGELRIDLDAAAVECLAPDGLEIFVVDDDPAAQQDAYFATGLACDPLAAAVVEIAEVLLIDATRTAFSNDAIPAVPPDPTAFDVALLVVAGCPPPTAGVCDPPTDGFSLAGSVDSIVRVPEAAPAVSRLAALLALCAVASARRRRGELAGGAAPGWRAARGAARLPPWPRASRSS